VIADRDGCPTRVAKSPANLYGEEVPGVKGFIRRRGESWELRAYAGVDPVSGKKRYVSRTVRGGKRDAQRELAAMVVTVERGMAARTSATVGQLLEAWFAVAREDFSPKTVKETKGMLDRYLAPALGHVSLGKLGAGDLDQFHRGLVAHGGVRGAPPSNRTAGAA
jgi:integrase